MILYTAHSRSSAGVLTGDAGSFEPEIMTRFQSVNGWGRERSKIRRFITDTSSADRGRTSDVTMVVVN
jgi:hypothetical protein